MKTVKGLQWTGSPQNAGLKPQTVGSLRDRYRLDHRWVSEMMLNVQSVSCDWSPPIIQGFMRYMPLTRPKGAHSPPFYTTRAGGRRAASCPCWAGRVGSFAPNPADRLSPDPQNPQSGHSGGCQVKYNVAGAGSVRQRSTKRTDFLGIRKFTF